MYHYKWLILLYGTFISRNSDFSYDKRFHMFEDMDESSNPVRCFHTNFKKK